MRKYLAISALLLTAACGDSVQEVETSRTKTLNTIDLLYSSAVVVAQSCVALEVPPCNAVDTRLAIDKSQDILTVAVSRAKDTIAASKDLNTIQLGLRIVLDAIAVYAKVMQTYKIEFKGG